VTTQLGVQAHFLHCFYSIEPIGFTAISTQKLFEHQADSWMADNSPRTDTSTDLEADAKLDDGHHGTTGVSTASDHETTKNGDSKALRRLAQNREAARKSRLRKKAYVQQLESSRIKLNQLEQELQRARQQNPHSASANGVNVAVNPGTQLALFLFLRSLEGQLYKEFTLL
jgi:hypothetical protein